MDMSTTFPRNLAYSIKELNAFSKQQIKVLTDHLSTPANAGDVVRIVLPPNSLIDTRTLSFHFDVTTALAGAGAGQTAHCPRYSSSFIERISVYVNNNLISSINQYNQYYNAVADLEFDYSQQSKRFLENIDPSVIYNINASAGLSYAAPTYVSNNQETTVIRATANAGNANETNKNIVINHWLNVLNSSSTPVWDTNSLGTVMIEIFLAPATILWSSSASTANTVVSGTPSYTLNNMRLCMSRISFQNDEYYNLLASKLLDESGLLIAYKDVYQVRSTSTAKSSSLSWNYNINANSLDSILCVPNRSDYNTFGYLQLFGSENVGTTQSDDGGSIATNYVNYTLNELLAVQGKVQETVNKTVGGTEGDFFNNSQYFQRKNTGFKNGQFLVNSITYDPYQKTLDEVYNEALINLGFKNLDVNGSCHVGLLSIWHFCKYYFVQVASFENLAMDNQYWKSGLSGNSCPINIQYNAQYDGNTSDSVYLNFFNVMTKILQVGGGRTITVI